MSTSWRVTAVLVISAVATLAIVSAFWGEQKPESTPPADSSSQPQEPGSETAEPSRTEHEATLQATAESVAASLLTALDELAASKTSESQSTNAEVKPEWPAGYRRTSFDLMKHFVSRLGRLQVKKLARHIQLNPNDVPLAAGQLAELERLLNVLNDHLEELRAAYRSIWKSEMIAAINAGEVEPAPVTRPDDATLRKLANEAISEGKYPGVPIEKVMEELRGRIISLPANAIRHKGKIYYHASFERLPATDRAHDVMRFFAFDALGVVSSWFVTMGVLSSQGQTELLTQGNNVTRMDIARSGPLFWKPK